MSYDSNTTYIILNANLGSSITDVNGNVYNYNSSFSNYTYTNSNPNISIFFNADSYANYTYITGVVLGNNFNIVYSEGAFENCTSISSLIISTGVTETSTQMFQGCTSLTSINFPSSVTTIGIQSFQGCGFTTITIPSSVTSIGEAAFQDSNSLTTVYILSNNINIGTYAFFECFNLNAVYVYSNQTITVGAEAFSYISGNAVLYTTTANINNTSLTQYFSSVINLDSTNYYVAIPDTSFVDLYTIFAPYSGGMDASATGFIVNNYGGFTGQTDLNQIFAINNGVSYSNPTNYIVENYAGLGQSLDLNQIFAPIPITYTQTGATVSSSPTYNTILTFTNSGTFRITSNTNVQIYCEVVGPGGNGGIANSSYDVGGGGAGGIVTNTIRFTNGLYTINVGLTSGNSSSISGGSINVTASSGNNGNNATTSSYGTGGSDGGGGGGNGGNGGKYQTSNTIAGASKTANTIIQCGGGGGSGGNGITDQVPGTGGLPFGGKGGGFAVGGVNGSGFGGGGGGGSCGQSTTVNAPGNGYQGIVVLYFNV